MPSLHGATRDVNIILLADVERAQNLLFFFNITRNGIYIYLPPSQFNSLNVKYRENDGSSRGNYKKGEEDKERRRQGRRRGEGDSMHLCLQESCICYLELFKNK